MIKMVGDSSLQILLRPACLEAKEKMSLVEIPLFKSFVKKWTLHSDPMSCLQLCTSWLTTEFTLPLEALFMACPVKFRLGREDLP